MLDPLPAEVEPGPTLTLGGHRHIVAGAALLGGMTVLAKLVALGKDWLVARRFGAGDELDAFLIALVIPTLAAAVLAHSFSAGFLPTYIRVWQREGADAAGRLVGSVLVGGCVVLIGVTLVLVAAAGYLFPWLGTSFDESKRALCESLFYILAGIVLATGVSAVFAAVLNAHEHFASTALAPLAVPVATVAVLWLFQDHFGIRALAGGTMLGFVLECSVLAVGLQCYGLLPRPRWGGLDENLRHVAWQYAPVALGALLTSSSVVVDPLMAASLGSGNVSVLNYGNKIVALVVSVVAVSLSTVLFPRFSRLITLGRWRELRRTLRVYATAVVIGSIPGLIVLGLVSEPLIRLLFERGAFAAETTQAVAQVQIWLLPQVPLAVLVMLGYRMLSALGSNSIVLGLGVLSLALNVGGNWLLMQWFGVTGIAMSTSLTILIVAIATLAVVRYKLGQAEAAAPEPSEQ